MSLSQNVKNKDLIPSAFDPQRISLPMHPYFAKGKQERIAVILKRDGDEKIS
jgi:hypothetical protein